VEPTFGTIIKLARQEKKLTQRQLAKLLQLDFTYLSKLENDRADYAAKEDVIRSIAQKLDLDEEEMIFLAGRTPTQYEDFLKQHYRQLPLLFRQMLLDPTFAERVFRAAQEEGIKN
jgi:HTH-type transcriptional regulator, competence development regulator